MDVLKGSIAGNMNYGFVGWGEGSDPIPAEFELPIKVTPYVWLLLFPLLISLCF